MIKNIFQDKKLAISYILTVPIMALVSAFFSKSMGPLLDEVIHKSRQKAISAIIIFSIMGLLDILISYKHKMIREQLRTKFLIAIKKDAFSGIMNMDFIEYHKVSPSYYISMMQRDVRKVGTDYFDSICGIYRVITCFIVTFIVLIQINPWICFINIIISFFSVFLPEFLRDRIEVASRKASDYAADYQGVVSDALSGFRTIKLFSVSQKINEFVEQKNMLSEKTEFESVKINYQVSYISIAMSQIGFILTMAIGTYRVIKGDMTVGAVVAISQLIGGILVPFEELPVFITNLKSIRNIKDKIENISAIQNAGVKITNSKKIEIEDIELKDINVSYDAKKQVLNDISFKIEKNKKYILVGESGSGKSTIAKLLVKMVTPTSGKVQFGKKDLFKLPNDVLYRIVNYMQQEVFLFEDTLLNNITLYQEYSQKEIDRVINCVGLNEYINELPEGLQTKILNNGYNLSAGQKQRIGIARTLLSGAKILIFDEITSNLDILSEKMIEEMIINLEDVTILMITHNLNAATLRRADKLFVLKNGRIHESGTYEELLEKKEYFYGLSLIKADSNDE